MILITPRFMTKLNLVPRASAISLLNTNPFFSTNSLLTSFARYLDRVTVFRNTKQPNFITFRVTYEYQSKSINIILMSAA